MVTALLLLIVAAIFEDKSRCGTGGGSLFLRSTSLEVNLALRPASETCFQDGDRSDVEVVVLLVSRCEVVDVEDLGARCSFEPHANSRSLSTPSNVEDIMTLDDVLGTFCFGDLGRPRKRRKWRALSLPVQATNETLPLINTLLNKVMETSLMSLKEFLMMNHELWRVLRSFLNATEGSDDVKLSNQKINVFLRKYTQRLL